MNSRTVATLLTIAAAAGLYFVARDYPALDVGLGAAACALVAAAAFLALRRQRRVHARDDLLRAGRLEHVVENAQVQPLDGALQRAVARQDDDGNLGQALAGALGHLQPAQPRHLEIEQQQVERALVY